MKDVCVITGGGSGIGLSTAHHMPKEQIVVLSGRTVSKLEKAVQQLSEQVHEAYAYTCDTADRASVHSLAVFAASI